MKNIVVKVTPCMAYRLPYDLNMSPAKVWFIQLTGRSQSAPVYANMLREAGVDFILNKSDHIQSNAAQGPVHSTEV